MKSPARLALSIAAACVLLPGCGGRGESTSAIPLANFAQALTQSRTFYYTGAKQSFVVPAGVTQITVLARGGGGGDSCARTGRGARVYAVIPVTPKERLDIYVGGGGGGASSFYNGGFNGGGDGGYGYDYGAGAGGGGASDVRQSPGQLSDRIIVAGGGAGAGRHVGHHAQMQGSCGGAGGEIGQAGERGYRRDVDPRRRHAAGKGGGGGTQTGGGTSGNGGSAFRIHFGDPGGRGALGVGGGGGWSFSSPSDNGQPGGGGGGGYYGGGGGGQGVVLAPGGGGGGGSSYAEPSATNVRFWTNWKNASGDGLIVFSW